MAAGGTLPFKSKYKGGQQPVRWEGRLVERKRRFARYLRDVVRPRISDEDSSFASDLRGLATTGMESCFVESLLHTAPKLEGWEIGEALAECTLRDSARSIHWPWNTVRDRRTPRASLPGADLVGFCGQGKAAVLLLGEVKTSSDPNAPPSVMNGRTGMKWQLKRIATSHDVRFSLLQWLHARCHTQFSKDLWRSAVRHFLESDGSDIALVGILMRDTRPTESDLKPAALALASQLSSPTRVQLTAWYLPVPVARWTRLMREETP